MVSIVDSVPNDVYAIRRVQKITWLDTYPNLELGISKEDIEQKFANDYTVEGKLKLEERKQTYSDPEIHTWVVRDDEEIIGFCSASKKNEVNKVGAIYILPVFQGQKIGASLMGKALDWLGNDKDVYINVASYNQKAINFYKKFGFIETGKKIKDDQTATLPSGAKIPETEMVKKPV